MKRNNYEMLLFCQSDPFQGQQDLAFFSIDVAMASLYSLLHQQYQEEWDGYTRRASRVEAAVRAAVWNNDLRDVVLSLSKCTGLLIDRYQLWSQ